MEPENIRKRGQILPMAAATLVALFTLANAGANMIPVHRESAAEVRHTEEQTIIEARRDRIASLVATGDGCKPVLAHELAQALVMDGRSARGYADDYAERCGEDPVMAHWGAAPVRAWQATRRR